jgi:predicted TIM-barrel fold metal-dependent hydrolase
VGDATPVIDMWAPIVPSREIVAHIRDHFPPVMSGYLRIFFKREPDHESFRKMADAMVQDDETILKGLDEAGIDRALITGFDETSTAGSAFVTNEAVAAIAERHPSRFLAFAGADIMRGSAAGGRGRSAAPSSSSPMRGC